MRKLFHFLIQEPIKDLAFSGFDEYMNSNVLDLYSLRSAMPGTDSSTGRACQWTTLGFSFQPQDDVVPVHVIFQPNLGQIVSETAVEARADFLLGRKAR